MEAGLHPGNGGWMRDVLRWIRPLRAASGGTVGGFAARVGRGGDAGGAAVGVGDSCGGNGAGNMPEFRREYAGIFLSMCRDAEALGAE